MTTSAPPVGLPATKTITATATETKKRLTSPWASLIAIVIAVLWTIPTFGLLVTSFRRPLDITRSGWWTGLTGPFTIQNYQTVLNTNQGGATFKDFFVNSLVITIPAVIIPLTVGALAAYAFAWINFRGSAFLFICVFALQIVPIQVTMIPLLSLYVKFGLAGTFWTVWLSHSIFALPLCIFILHNFISQVPRELVEAARVDGANHVRVFVSVMLPLLRPALVAFGIFQFLWVWNDLLVALVFAGGSPDILPLTVALANLAGTRGTAWYLLAPGAFIAITLPVVIFLSLQRYFVRGLLAGSVKG
jgi:alpha-glucoside transport system permease protein